MAKYRKKPVIIEAIQYDGSIPSAQAICDWANGDKQLPICDFITYKSKETAEDFQVHTLEGIMAVNIGDWIIRGIKGEFYPCKPDIFEQTYELVKK